MGRRPDQVEFYCPGFAADDADTAPIAVFLLNLRLHLLGTGHFDHLNGAKRAALHTGLAAGAFIFFYRSQEPAGSI